MFLRGGIDPVQAHHMALRVIDGIVEQQATLMAFNRVFLLAGVAFLLVLPVLTFLKVPDDQAPGPKKKVEVHVE